MSEDEQRPVYVTGTYFNHDVYFDDTIKDKSQGWHTVVGIRNVPEGAEDLEPPRPPMVFMRAPLATPQAMGEEPGTNGGASYPAVHEPRAEPGQWTLWCWNTKFGTN